MYVPKQKWKWEFSDLFFVVVVGVVYSNKIRNECKYKSRLNNICVFFCENNWKREGHKNKNKNKKQKYKSNNNKFIVCLFLNKKQTTTKRRKKNVKNQNKIIKIDKNFLNKNSYTLAKFFFYFLSLGKNFK